MGRCIRPGDFFRRGETPRELRSANWGAIMTASMQTDETSSERTFLIDELIRGRRAKRGFTNRPVPIETVCSKFKQYPALAMLRADGEGSRTGRGCCRIGGRRWTPDAFSGGAIFPAPTP